MKRNTDMVLFKGGVAEIAIPINAEQAKSFGNHRVTKADKEQCVQKILNTLGRLKNGKY